MAKTWTRETVLDQGQFKAKDFNGDASGIAGEFNGQLGQLNMPLSSASEDTFVKPSATLNAFGVGTRSTYMATQSYHSADFIIDNEDTTSAVISPATAFISNYEDDNWSAFYNNFDYAVVTEGTRLRFNAKEGLLIGCLTMSGERRTGRKTVSAGSVDVGNEEWWEASVYVNNVLVGRSGEIQVGAYTIALPFSTPIGSEFCEITVRWSGSVAAYDGSLAATAWPSEDFKVFAMSGCQLWCRNQYR